MARSSSAKKFTKPNWLELPPELTKAILMKLCSIDILVGAQKVCSSWWRICKDPLMWKSIDMYNLGDLHDMRYNLETMARHAIDRSCGGLVDINIEYFGTDELLEFITARTTQLRSLRLVCHYGMISDEALCEAALKLPLLAELDLTISYFSKETLETVGRCCPLLKSFKYNGVVYSYPDISDIECNEQAFAIAQSMHSLHHLQLIGNNLKNDGLQAILDGCPHLISLDLRRCLNINLTGDLGKRCAEQIKELRHPNDSTKDYGFQTGVDQDHDYNGSPADNYPCRFSDIYYNDDEDEDEDEDEDNDDDDDDDEDEDEDDDEDEDGDEDDDDDDGEAELDDMKKRLKEIEDEAAVLHEMQAKVEKEMCSVEDTGTAAASQANKEEVDSRSIFVGNVDYSCTPEEVQQHFQSCGTVNRVTIRCNKYGQPKGYAYVEFLEPKAVQEALLLNESELHGRWLKISAKRTNVPGMKQFRPRPFL